MSLRHFTLCLAALVAAMASARAKPALFIIGDSTVRNSTAGQQGWGDPLVAQFDPAKIEVFNRAIGGRSSRTFLTDGRWAAILAQLKPGDFVLMQFGHNDGGPLNDDRARASLKGNGEATEDLIRKADGKPETVHSFGWYLRNYARDAKAKGATPIVASLIPRNIWNGEKIIRSTADYGLWASQAAAQEQAHFIDFNGRLADRFEALGPAQTAALFSGTDHTHTSAAGAAFNAGVMAAAIRSLPGCELGKALLPEKLWLPSVFSDHMVMQRDLPLPVWGSATPAATVNVKIAGQSVTATADAQGHWRTAISALPAGGPFTLQVTGAGTTLTVADVLVGEVWLCSGQSNMDFTLASTAKRSFAGVTDWQQEVAAANHPQLRMFTAEWTMRELPQREVAGKWAVCNPETAADFSAVAYYFGRSIQQQLKVPVGLVTCAYGASTIEAWIREETLQAHPQFAGLLQEFGKQRTTFRDNPKLLEDYGKQLAKAKAGRPPKNPDPVQDQHNPFVLHNGMIAPVAPYAIRGAIWYQGESNGNTRQLYPALQQTLIEDWRALWKKPELPFYFVQLAAYKAPPTDPNSGSQLAEMRAAQASSLAIPHTGMAVTIDIGDEKNVHPRNKLDVGRRLALLALTRTYGQPGVATGPTFRDAVVEGSRIRVRFDPGAGLVAKGGPLRQFAIAAADRKFVWAEATIDGDSVLVSSPAVPRPAFVRYAWADNPVGANLVNTAGLPAAPFRTDP
jgi:sialate O-acetylesterase